MCLFTSNICFDTFKTDDLVCLSSSTCESNKIIASDYSVSNEDVCTVEMLGNTHISLPSQQAAKRNGVTHKKSETLLVGIDNSATSKSQLYFFTSVNANICPYNTDATETIIFIHNKDGKKESDIG